MIEIKTENCTTALKASGTKTELLTDAFCTFIDCCKLLNMHDEERENDENLLGTFLDIVTKSIFTGDVFDMARDRSGISNLKHTRIHIEIPNMNDTEGVENADD